MTIRNTLAALFLVFGLTLISLLIPQVISSYRTYSATKDQIVVDQARNDVFGAVLAIREGRAALNVLAMQGEIGVGVGVRLGDDLAAAVRFLTRASQTFARSENPALQPLSEPLAQQADRLSGSAIDLARITALGDLR